MKEYYSARVLLELLVHSTRQRAPPWTLLSLLDRKTTLMKPVDVTFGFVPEQYLILSGIKCTKWVSLSFLSFILVHSFPWDLETNIVPPAPAAPLRPHLGLNCWKKHNQTLFSPHRHLVACEPDLRAVAIRSVTNLCSNEGTLNPQSMFLQSSVSCPCRRVPLSSVCWRWTGHRVGSKRACG